MDKAHKTGGMDRRSVLKLGATAGTALLLGAGAGAGKLWVAARIELDAWRARPGARLPVSLLLEGPDASSARPEAHAVELDARGAVVRVLGPVALARGDQGPWRGQVQVPAGADPSRESYMLAVAALDGQGRVAFSPRVEIVCTPLRVGL